MNYWLIKSDPDTYPFEQMQKDGRTFWSGVRNYAARIHLRAMKTGDMCFFYQSVGKPELVGTVEVMREAYQDPTTEDTAWVCVDVEFREAFAQPVTLAEIKQNPKLKDMVLLRISRLSVQPVTAGEWKEIMKMAKAKK